MSSKETLPAMIGISTFLILLTLFFCRQRLDKIEEQLKNMNINVKCYCDGKLLEK